MLSNAQTQTGEYTVTSNTNEILGATLLTLHNINFYQELMFAIRENIKKGTFDIFHDEYIDNLVAETPGLVIYNWTRNMCYGTAEHINAIKEHGITPYHRKSFGPCK